MTALFSRNRRTYLIGGRRRMDVPSPDSLWRSWLVVGTWRRKTLINGGAGIRSCLLRRRACIDLPPVAPVYFLLSLEECVRLALSLRLFKKRSWMQQL